jgi:WhiB family transcriptional regulator, redox-sensing transcriptional regulator
MSGFEYSGSSIRVSRPQVLAARLRRDMLLAAGEQVDPRTASIADLTLRDRPPRQAQTPDPVWVGSAISRPLKVRGQRDEEIRDEDDWRDAAACASLDPESLFSETGDGHDAAKRVCETCSVRVECLKYTLNNDEQFGVWGGLTRKERLALGDQQDAAG